jgi:predicted HAD superfamily Cof-like phosphohydrolase
MPEIDANELLALNEKLDQLEAQVKEYQDRERRVFVDDLVRAFHERAGLPAPLVATLLPAPRVRYRTKLMLDEFFELLEATFSRTDRDVVVCLQVAKQKLDELVADAPIDLDLVEYFDATHDVDYTVAGTRVEFGYDGWKGTREVHAANMRKLVGEPPYVNDWGKVVKPLGWVAPDIVGVLRAQGFVP